MFVDGWLLFAIYFISVLALAVSGYAVWSLEEIRLYYKRLYSQRPKTYSAPQVTVKTKSQWKK